MLDPSFLGISKSQWELVNSFGSWLSAIGSLAAVWVALHLANRIATPSAKMTVGHRVAIEPGSAEPFPEYVVFQIVNLGDRTIRINQIGWKVGLSPKRFAMQTFESSISSKLPIELTHGQEAHWFVPLDARKEPWLTYFSKAMLMPNYRTSCFTLRAQCITSVGHVFIAKPEKGLLKKLKAECEQFHNEKPQTS